jgi:hypothetical protein
MEEEKDILERVAKALKDEPIPAGPPKDLIDTTLSKLSEAAEQADTLQIEHRIRIRERLRALGKFSRVAAAAVFLIAAGYVVGRVSAPRPPDMKELQAALTPAIRRELLDEIDQHLEASYVSLTEDLDRKYRQNLSRAATQILAASNTVTNERLADFIETFNESQAQERQLFATMLERMESNRLQDRAALSDALVTVAQRTKEEMDRTKEDVAQLLSYSRPAGAPDESRE